MILFITFNKSIITVTDSPTFFIVMIFSFIIFSPDKAVYCKPIADYNFVSVEFNKLFTEEEMKDIIIGNRVEIEVLFKPYEVNEDYLLPNSTDNFISKTHIARLINLLIDKMDITDIIKTYKGGGTTSNNPRMLLKAWISGLKF